VGRKYLCSIIKKGIKITEPTKLIRVNLSIILKLLFQLIKNMEKKAQATAAKKIHKSPYSNLRFKKL